MQRNEKIILSDWFIPWLSLITVKLKYFTSYFSELPGLAEQQISMPTKTVDFTVMSHQNV